MSFKDLVDLITKNWPLLIAAMVLLAPITGGLASLYYSGRIESLREQINLIKMQKEFVEHKLRSMEKLKVDIDEKGGGEVKVSAAEISSLQYPQISDPKKLSREDIKRLADYYDLTKAWQYNPHLKMQEGDISYWYEQGMTEDEIRLQFESRRIVLQEANQNKQTIATQGDLSALAQKIQARLIKASTPSN